MEITLLYEVQMFCLHAERAQRLCRDGVKKGGLEGQQGRKALPIRFPHPHPSNRNTVFVILCLKHHEFQGIGMQSTLSLLPWAAYVVGIHSRNGHSCKNILTQGT